MSDLFHDGMPFTLTQAPELGLNLTALRARLRHGLLRRVFHGVYVDSRVPDSRDGRMRSVSLVAPRNAVVSDETAAWLYGLDVFAPGQRHNFNPALVARHGRGRVRHSGSRGRQALLAADDVRFVNGIYVTTPTRTVSDLLRKQYRPYALAAADSFAHAGLVTKDEVVDYVARLKGYRGIVQARSLAAIIEPRSESAGESWQRLRILDAGFPPPEPQFEIVDEFGRSYFLDLPYPEMLIGTEYDGSEFHTDSLHREHDDDRRGYLSEVYGWRWVIGNRKRIFGDDTSFEDELGELLGIQPMPRRWGTGNWRPVTPPQVTRQRAASDPSAGRK